MKKFADIVEDVKTLNEEELEEIKHIADKLMIEAARQRIYNNGLVAKNEFKEGKLKNYSNFDELKSDLLADD
ncbi:MAG: hypothetical protein WCO28_00895 [Bacteroidota bacterium]